MASVLPYGCFTHAVVRCIPETFGKVDNEKTDKVENGETMTDLAKAQRQFGVLTGALRQKVGLQLIEIPADPELPESWRIEDVAVIQGDTALITRPFKQQRRREAEAVRRVMSELNLTVVELGAEEGGSVGATLEGSDVLFTGREFFDFAVSTVPVCEGARLKNICSMGGPDTIIISNSDGAKKTLRSAAANCVYVRGPSKVDYLLHRPTEECPDSVPAFQKLTDYTLLPTACSEASKLGGYLSSFCLLINRKPYF
ncbi:unnamed protein product [Coregonus sp. 'balchen']|nr:unnamed protein product [Coregonus sp. 'balchen']